MPGESYYGKGYGRFANLPQDVTHVEFPAAREGMNIDLDDTARGIDANKEYNARMMKQYMSEEKY